MPELETHKPSALAILRVFFGIGFVSVGGGGSANIHEAVVERRQWMSEAEFVEAMTVARSLPGTNVSNLAAFVGAHLAGWRGAFCAASAVVLPGAVIVIAVALAYGKVEALHSPLVQGALHGLTAGAVGVMAALVWQTATKNLKGPVAFLAAGAAFVAIGYLALNMAAVLVALVPVTAAATRKSD